VSSLLWLGVCRDLFSYMITVRGMLLNKLLLKSIHFPFSTSLLRAVLSSHVH
jgi:hypothetical protein